MPPAVAADPASVVYPGPEPLPNFNFARRRQAQAVLSVLVFLLYIGLLAWLGLSLFNSF
jgi:hypothetical protein